MAPLGNGTGLGTGVGTGVGTGTGDGTGLGLGLGFGDGFGDGTGLGATLGFGDGTGLGTGEGTGLGLGLGTALGDGFGDGIGFCAGLILAATLRLNAAVIAGETEGVALLPDTVFEGAPGDGDGELGTTLADNDGLMAAEVAMLECSPGDSLSTIDEGIVTATLGCCPFATLPISDGLSSQAVSLGGDFLAKANNFPGSCPKALAHWSAIF